MENFHKKLMSVPENTPVSGLKDKGEDGDWEVVDLDNASGSPTTEEEKTEQLRRDIQKICNGVNVYAVAAARGVRPDILMRDIARFAASLDTQKIQTAQKDAEWVDVKLK